MRRQSGLLLSLASTLLSGCASIMNPGPDKVTFNSDPPGATINLDGKDIGQTPATIAIDHYAFVAKMSLPGYKEATVPIQYNTNGWLYADFIFFPILFGDGTVIAMEIDAGTRGDRNAVSNLSAKLEKAN